MPPIGQMPLVSTVIAVYNGEDFIGEAINSVLNQTYPNVEIIVVDDGSTDATQSILKSFGEKITWTWQKNSGTPAARNVGVRMSQGKYIALLDCDDLWLPDKIRMQLEAFERYPEAVLVWGGAVRSNKGWTNEKNDQEYHKERKFLDLKELLIHNRIAALAAMFRRDVAISIDGFDEALLHCDDWDMWIRLAQLGSMVYVDQTLGIYRVHEKQMTKKSYNLSLGELSVVKKHRDTFYRLHNGRGLYRSEIARRLSVAAMESIKVRQYQGAWRLSFKAIMTLKTDVWPTCMKIILECLLGTHLYTKMASFVKKLGHNDPRKRICGFEDGDE